MSDEATFTDGGFAVTYRSPDQRRAIVNLASYARAQAVLRRLAARFADGDRQWRNQQRHVLRLEEPGNAIELDFAGGRKLGLVHAYRAAEDDGAPERPVLLTLPQLRMPFVCSSAEFAERFIAELTAKRGTQRAPWVVLEAETLTDDVSELERLLGADARSDSEPDESLKPPTSSIEAIVQRIAERANDVPEPKYRCKRCEDSGRIVVAWHQWGAPKAYKDCECQKLRQVARRAAIVSKPVPSNFRDWSFENSHHIAPSALGRLRRYVSYYLAHTRDHSKPPPKGLWIVGTSGAIKTGAAAVVVKEIGHRLPRIDAHNWLGWWGLNKLLRELRATQGDQPEVSERQLHLALASVHMLVLDDIVAPRITPFAAEALYGILDARYEEGMPTIVTTNLIDENRLEQVIGGEDRERGESIVRRIRERCIRVELPVRTKEHADDPFDVDESILAPKPDEDDFWIDDDDTGYGRRREHR